MSPDAARPVARTAACCAVVLGVCAAVAAQTGTAPPPGPQVPPPWPSFPRTQDQQQTQPGWMPPPYGTSQPVQQQQYTGFPGVELVTPEFRGFPVFTPGRPAFGGYPGYTPPETLPPGFAPPAGALRPPGLWPSWVTPGRSEDEARARADRAMLVANSERVWYRAADESAFVPLPFYDKVREVAPGARVEVRTMSGEFTMVLHDGASVRSAGRASVEIRALSEAVAEAEVADAHRMWWRAKLRPLRLRFPDGSVVEFADAEVWVARDGDRFRVRNYGPSAARLVAPLGAVDLGTNQQVVLLATPMPPDAVPSPLVLDGAARARFEGRTLHVEAAAGTGRVDWLGARVVLSRGERVTIDPLAGTTFPEYRPAPGRAGAQPTGPQARPEAR